MKVAQLTPGTGNFFCENCLHDSALVKGLTQLGVEASIIPMYLPIMEEDPVTSSQETPIQFGGVNTYLQQKSALFRHTPSWIDSLMNTPAVLNYAASRPSTTKASLVGEILVSMLKGQQGNQSKEIRKLATYIHDHIKPDVVILSNIMLLGLAAPLKSHLNVPIICSMQGEDVYMDEVPEPYSTQAWELIREKCSDVSHFIAVSDYYANEMKRRLSLTDEDVSVVHSGIDINGYEPKQDNGHIKTVTFMSRIIADKGIQELIQSVAALRNTRGLESTRLIIAGSATPADNGFISEMRSLAESLGLAEQFEIRTNLSRNEKVDLLSRSHVVSVPCRYADAFGLFIPEALAAGAVLAQPDHGGFSEVINDTGGGLCYDPGNVDALTQALITLLGDETKRQTMANNGRQRVLQEYTNERMAQKTLSILKSFQPAG